MYVSLRILPHVLTRAILFIFRDSMVSVKDRAVECIRRSTPGRGDPMILYNSVLLLAALNLAVNAVVGLLVLLRYPWPVWPIPIKHPDHLRHRLELRATEKGETAHEKTVV